MDDKMRPHPKPDRAVHFIRQWRKLRGFTQEELADLIGVSPPTISQIENYKTGYTGETLSALAQALSVTRGDLLEVDPTKDSSLWKTLESLKQMNDQDQSDILAVLNTLISQKVS